MSNDNERPPSYPPRIRRTLARSDNSSHPFQSSIPVQYTPTRVAIPVGLSNRDRSPASKPWAEDERERRRPVRENSVPEIDTLSPPPSRSPSKTSSDREGRVDNTAYQESHERSAHPSDHEGAPGGRKGKGREESAGARARFHPYTHGASSRGVQFPSSAEREYRDGRGSLHTGPSSSASRRSHSVYDTDSEIEPSSPGAPASPPRRSEDSDDDHSDRVASDIDELDSDSDEDRPIPPSQLSGGVGPSRSVQSTWRPPATTSAPRRERSEERFTPPEQRYIPRVHNYQYVHRPTNDMHRSHDPRELEPISPRASGSARTLPPPSGQYGYGEGPSTSRAQRSSAPEQHPLPRPLPPSLERYPPPRAHVERPYASTSQRYDQRQELPPRRPIDPRPLENVSNPYWTPYSPGRPNYPLSPAKFSPPPPPPPPPPQPSRPPAPIQVTIPEREPDSPEPLGGTPAEGPPGLKFIIPPHAILTRRSPLPPSLPSDLETEAVLRNVTGLPAPMPLNLSSLRDAGNRRELPKLSMLMALAIWGSPAHMLTLSGIIRAIEIRFPFMQFDDSWKRTIRHKLSFVSAFVRAGKHNEGWVLDVRKSFAGRGAKRLAELRAAAKRDRGE